MDIVNPAAQAYAEKYSSGEDDLLKEISEHTLANHSKAHMLSGHLQGKFLEMISYMIRPSRILEIGTFTGYSALCLEKGLAADGTLHTIEIREDDAATAGLFFQKKDVKRILLHVGEALNIIGQLEETWDLVFIDADKVSYSLYFKSVLPKVRAGGFILVDNVLFHGQVLEAEIRGKNAKAIHEFNDMIAARTDVEKVLLPLRDGLYLIRKL
ncbi:MAG: O-methyltransferase [Flaviaesturariibacter sp.]|nr:O-methyltransferase [Flaviaesturariibacter sp.]